MHQRRAKTEVRVGNGSWWRHTGARINNDDGLKPGAQWEDHNTRALWKIKHREAACGWIRDPQPEHAVHPGAMEPHWQDWGV